MIDWHCHILPGIDDGSRDVAESVSMVESQMSQRVDILVATPHFDANDESVKDFLARRDAAYQALKPHLPGNAPQIVLGAEVRYYPGVSRLEGLQELCLGDSTLLLLELPMREWTESVIRELLELSGRSDMRILLAHVERYLRLQKREVWNRLQEAGILMQINTSYILSPASRRKALAGLAEGKFQFIGSDCHNMTSRPPRMGKAMEIVAKKIGTDYIREIDEFGQTMLVENE